MSQIAVHLNDEQSDRIDAIARSRRATPSDVIEEAVARYLDHEDRFRAAVRQGVAEADRGETDDFDAYAVNLRARMATSIALAGE